MPAEVLDQLQSNKKLYNIILQNYPSLLALRSTSEQKLNVEPIEGTKSKPIKMSMKLKLNKKEKEKKKEFEVKLDQVREKLLQPIPENKPAVIVQRERPDWWTRQFVTDHHYLRGIRVHRNSIMHRGAMMNIAKYKLRASSCPDIYRNSMWSVEEEQNVSLICNIFVDVFHNYCTTTSVHVLTFLYEKCYNYLYIIKSF